MMLIVAQGILSVFNKEAGTKRDIRDKSDKSDKSDKQRENV